jgi:hypothetical protein
MLDMFARVRTYNPRFAHRQVPDVGDELRIFADSDTAFIAFGKDPTGNLTKRFKLAVLRGENS